MLEKYRSKTELQLKNAKNTIIKSQKTLKVYNVETGATTTVYCQMGADCNPLQGVMHGVIIGQPFIPEDLHSTLNNIKGFSDMRWEAKKKFTMKLHEDFIDEMRAIGPDEAGFENVFRVLSVTTNAQIKLNKEMHKLSQAKTSDPKRLAPALNQQAPVVETEPAMVVGMTPP